MYNVPLLRLLLFFVMLHVASSIYAQRLLCPSQYRKLKHHGLWTGELLLGPKEWSGDLISLGTVYYFQQLSNYKGRQYAFPSQYLKFNLTYARDSEYNLEHWAYVAELTAGYIPIDIKGIIYISALAGGFLSYDQLAVGEVDNQVKEELTQLKPGALMGIEILAFVGPSRWALVAQGTQRYRADDYWGNKRRYVAFGVRYHFMPMKLLKGKKKRKSPKK